MDHAKLVAADLSSLASGSTAKEKRRILIVDDDANSTDQHSGVDRGN
jgi:hypothetical protein